MVPYLPPQKINHIHFLYTGLSFLGFGLFFGICAALQYVFPGIGRDLFSFEKLRPLHVSAVVFWIIMTAIGSMLTYIQQHQQEKFRYQSTIPWVYFLFTITFVSILTSYAMGIFGGREYWEFHPLFAIPILIGWILCILLVLQNLSIKKRQPVYVWMWLTGLCFFLFTYVESYMWLIPFFRNNLVKDMTIQWKSYGSMVGSWNMILYGSSIFLMQKISEDTRYSHSKISFLLYFLGLFNLMFNWGHHIYTLPTANYIKHIGYLVSMTELLIFGRILWLWKGSISTAKKHFHHKAYQFLLAADIWVFLTLGLAIGMSIPALNIWIHGTHVVVAHTMGASIGINSMLLLGYCYDILHPKASKQRPSSLRENWGYLLIQFCLAVFWISLIIAGIMKAYWQFNPSPVPYSGMLQNARVWFVLFFLSGIGLCIGFIKVLSPLFSRKQAC
jgi:nitric oxide reductase subunit B